MQAKRALITGITGQDGSYLAELLVRKGYQVWGLVRRASASNLSRIQHLVSEPPAVGDAVRLIHGDLCDGSSLQAALEAVVPDEVYHLAAQSHVKVSFELPVYTADVTGLGTVRLLESLRSLCPTARFFFAASSEMFGQVETSPQTERTGFHPRSPYAAAKVFGFDMARNYRESYGIFTASGIMFNHESPRRGEAFVTRKITRAVAAIVHGQQDQLCLGNLNARRDWGFAGDFVQAMWRMLEIDRPDDFVIATGQTHSVRDFCSMAFAHAGLPLTWTGQGIDERGIGPHGRTLVRVDPKFFRPAEVDQLCGDASKAHKVLGWQPTVSFHQLVKMMVDADVADLARQRTSSSDLWRSEIGAADERAAAGARVADASSGQRPESDASGQRIKDDSPHQRVADDSPDQRVWYRRDSARPVCAPHARTNVPQHEPF